MQKRRVYEHALRETVGKAHPYKGGGGHEKGIKVNCNFSCWQPPRSPWTFERKDDKITA